MSGRPRFIPRLAVLSGVLVTALLVSVAPAYAEADLDVEGPETVVAGGSPGDFQAVLDNDERAAYHNVQFQIVVSGLRRDQIQLNGAGRELFGFGRSTTVTFQDQTSLTLTRDGHLTRDYQLSVLTGAPNRKITIRIEAQGIQEDRFRRRDIASGSRSVLVSATGPTASAEPTALPTFGNEPSGLAGGGTAPEARAASTSNDLGTIWPIYLFGAVLLVMGGVVVGWLLIQRSRESEPEMALVDPGYTAPEAPTMVLPQVAPRHRTPQ
ncbi:MAG TPA: hypothetical protein VFC00_19170 [Micromonosporaceae bacterium]|nr:hypothetical protein [Micromonosporaceae bacterium]